LKWGKGIRVKLSFSFPKISKKTQQGFKLASMLLVLEMRVPLECIVCGELEEQVEKDATGE
jgi:hypothetical protein